MNTGHEDKPIHLRVLGCAEETHTDVGRTCETPHRQ